MEAEYTGIVFSHVSLNSIYVAFVFCCNEAFSYLKIVNYTYFLSILQHIRLLCCVIFKQFNQFLSDLLASDIVFLLVTDA